MLRHSSKWKLTFDNLSSVTVTVTVETVVKPPTNKDDWFIHHHGRMAPPLLSKKGLPWHKMIVYSYVTSSLRNATKPLPHLPRRCSFSPCFSFSHRRPPGDCPQQRGCGMLSLMIESKDEENDNRSPGSGNWGMEQLASAGNVSLLVSPPSPPFKTRPAAYIQTTIFFVTLDITEAFLN